MNTSTDINKASRLLLFIQHNLTEETLSKLYGIEEGEKLWTQFVHYNKNLLMFINYLGESRRKTFMDPKNTKILFVQTKF